MTCVADNGAAVALTPCSLRAVSDERQSWSKEANNEGQVKVRQQSLTVAEQEPFIAVNLKPEDYIAFELSHIRELRGVYAYQQKGVYYITVYVDNRDLALNRRIFERESNLMSFYRRQYKFDLSIIPLQGRRLDEIKTKGMRLDHTESAPGTSRA